MVLAEYARDAGLHAATDHPLLTTLASNTRAGPPRWELWAGSIGIGLGCAAIYPIALTLPSEAHVDLTPVRLLSLTLASSAGEMLLPFVMGIAFEHGRYADLPTSCLVLDLVALVGTSAACAVASRGRGLRVGVERGGVRKTDDLAEDGIGGADETRKLLALEEETRTALHTPPQKRPCVGGRN